jgi:hypothetical protein
MPSKICETLLRIATTSRRKTPINSPQSVLSFNGVSCFEGAGKPPAKNATAAQQDEQ